MAALAENTNNIRLILEQMQGNGLKVVVYTGSVFEANEGAGNGPMRAFSPYGLSKGLTSEVMRHWCVHFAIPFEQVSDCEPVRSVSRSRASAPIS